MLSQAQRTREERVFLAKIAEEAERYNGVFLFKF
jgi:hypothetical protein